MSQWFDLLRAAADAGALEASQNSVQTYVEVTAVLIASVLTCMLVVKALPYITSSIAFFAKFCACAAVLSMCLRFIEHSALVKALKPFMSFLKYTL